MQYPSIDSMITGPITSSFTPFVMLETPRRMRYPAQPAACSRQKARALFSKNGRWKMVGVAIRGIGLALPRLARERKIGRRPFDRGHEKGRRPEGRRPISYPC